MKRRFLYATLGVALFGRIALSANISCASNAWWDGDNCDPCVCWTGIYLGLNGGWGWSDAKYDANPFGTSAPADFTPQLNVSNQINGPLFGGQAGFNWQIRNWVVGIEGDFDGTGINGFKNTSFPSLFALNAADTGRDVSSVYANLDWIGTIRGRLAMVWGPALIYATGGAAWEHVRTKTLDAASISPDEFTAVASSTFTNTQIGWVVGGGYERMIGTRWSLRAEYLHYHFGKGPHANVTFQAASPPTDGLNVSIHRASVDAIRLGVNYIFSL